MSLDSGSNAGITGIVDIVGAPQFNVRVYMFKDSTGATSVPNSGQSGGNQESSRGGLEVGDLVLDGLVRRDGYPAPSLMKNAIGTITIMYDFRGPLKKVNSIRVEKVVVKYDQKDANNWHITLICTRLGAAAWSGWTGTQITPTPPTPGTEYLYEGRQKVVDAQGLVGSSQQTIDFWGMTPNTDAGEVSEIAAIVAAYSTPPQTNQKLYSATLTMRTDGEGGRVVITWRLRNSSDDVTMPVAREWRSGLSAWTSSQPAIVTASNTMSNQADTLWAAFQSTAFARGLRLLQLNDQKRLAIYEYIDPGVELSGSTKGGRYAMSRMSGTNPQLYVTSNITNGAGQRFITFGRQWVVTPMRRFIIRRNLTGATIPEQAPSTINAVTMPLIGQCNNAPFLTNVTSSGMAAGQVFYEGPKYTVRTGSGSTFPFFMGYAFTSDALGIVNGFPDGLFRQRQPCYTNATNFGWTNVSLLGEPFATDIVAPSQASFAAFVT